MENKKLDKIVNRLKTDEQTDKVSYSVKLEKKTVEQLKTICKNNNIQHTDLMETILKDYGIGK